VHALMRFRTTALLLPSHMLACSKLVGMEPSIRQQKNRDSIVRVLMDYAKLEGLHLYVRSMCV
jgi:hypothetical protein